MSDEAPVVDWDDIDNEPVAQAELSEVPPSMTDPKWHEYVMSQFEPYELDEHGNPYVDGLRRVARKLIGRVVKSAGEVLSPPRYFQITEQTTRLEPTAARYTVVFATPDGLVEYSDVADVYFGNTEKEFARFPSATACTRAEARCLRKALQLRKVAAEETTKVPVDEAAIDGNISSDQINFLNIVCHRCNINIDKYIKSQWPAHDNIEKVPFKTAARLIEKLSSLQNNQKDIPEAIRGYDKNWRK